MKHIDRRKRAARVHRGLLAAGTFLSLLLAKPVAAQLPDPFPPSCPGGQGSIAGTLRDEAGAAVADAEVMAYSEAGDVLYGQGDGSGQYRLEQACAGRYVVLAYRDGNPALLGFHDADQDGEPDEVLLASNDSAISGIDIVLTDGEVVIGPEPVPTTCADPRGKILGRVLDAQGQGVAGIEVQVYGDTGMALALSQEDGSYQAEGLCAGAFLVFAWDQDPANPRMGMYDADGDLNPDEVQLAADDASANGVDLVLQAAVEVVPGPQPKVCEQPEFAASGAVRDPNGQPVSDATVLYFAEDGGYAESRTLADGSYQASLCGGVYMAVAYQLVDENTVKVGFFDADGDDEPDRLVVDADHPQLSGIDITLTMEDHPAPGAAGQGGAQSLRHRLAAWTALPAWAGRLARDQRLPRTPITVPPHRPHAD